MMKKCSVVKLPTNGKAEIFSKYEHNYESKSGYKLFNDSKGLNLLSNFTYHHLYILSDDKIEQENYFLADDRIRKSDNNGNPNWVLCKCITISDNGWIFCNEFTGEGLNPDWCKKIIATTDSSLQIKKESRKIGHLTFHNVYVDGLPQPSQSFINKYIEKYNKGEILNEVMVEYEQTFQDVLEGTEFILRPAGNRIKVNPKDNTITIKAVKDSWNREEVIQLIRTFDMMKGKDITTVEFDNWIEQNL